ncbi:MAG: hypothetical protein OXU45_06425 [Candidatus Melainabacteria bacterium]|nr:hypothetical protein [Candidatus Melainabacteria bacterium]
MYGQTNSYAYASNPGLGFLEDSMQSTLSAQAGQGGTFGQVMNQMSAGITQGAQQGRVPFGNQSQFNVQSAQAQRLGVQTFGGLTAAQIAQQMNTGGAASVLPMMGGNMMPQVVYPVAGLWTLYDGMKAVRNFRKEARLEQQNHTAFDPSQLRYNTAVRRIDAANDDYAYLGPLN